MTNTPAPMSIDDSSNTPLIELSANSLQEIINELSEETLSKLKDLSPTISKELFEKATNASELENLVSQIESTTVDESSEESSIDESAIPLNQLSSDALQSILNESGVDAMNKLGGLSPTESDEIFEKATNAYDLENLLNKSISFDYDDKDQDSVIDSPLPQLQGTPSVVITTLKSSDKDCIKRTLWSLYFYQNKMEWKDDLYRKIDIIPFDRNIRRKLKEKIKDKTLTHKQRVLIIRILTPGTKIMYDTMRVNQYIRQLNPNTKKVFEKIIDDFIDEWMDMFGMIELEVIPRMCPSIWSDIYALLALRLKIFDNIRLKSPVKKRKEYKRKDLQYCAPKIIYDNLADIAELYWNDLIIDVAKGNTDIDNRESLHEFLKKRYKMMKDEYGCAAYLSELRDPIITELEKRINDPEYQFNEEVVNEQMYLYEQDQYAEDFIDSQDLLPDEDDVVSMEYVRFLKNKPHIDKKIEKYPALDRYYDLLTSMYEHAVDAVENTDMDFDVPQFQHQGKQGVGWDHIIRLIRRMYEAAMAKYSQDVDIRDFNKVEELEKKFRDAAKLVRK